MFGLNYSLEVKIGFKVHSPGALTNELFRIFKAALPCDIPLSFEIFCDPQYGHMTNLPVREITTFVSFVRFLGL